MKHVVLYFGSFNPVHRGHIALAEWVAEHVGCDEVVLVEAKDADAASRVKEALDKRYQAKLNETENYLPDEYAVIKTCSVVMDGNYVAMIVAPNAADLVKIYNESFK